MRTWEDYKGTINNSEDLFSLSRNGDFTAVGEFLNSHPGIDIDQQNHKGHSPLMLAVYHGNQEVSEMFLKNGADPNSSDHAGNTVLMGAAFKGDVDSIALLIRHGALKELKNQNGMTAEEWASAFGRQKALALLQPGASHSLFQNFINFSKIFWGMFKPHFRKEVTA